MPTFSTECGILLRTGKYSGRVRRDEGLMILSLSCSSIELYKVSEEQSSMEWLAQRSSWQRVSSDEGRACRVYSTYVHKYLTVRTRPFSIMSLVLSFPASLARMDQLVILKIEKIEKLKIGEPRSFPLSVHFPQSRSPHLQSFNP